MNRLDVNKQQMHNRQMGLGLYSTSFCVLHIVKALYNFNWIDRSLGIRLSMVLDRFWVAMLLFTLFETHTSAESFLSFFWVWYHERVVRLQQYSSGAQLWFECFKFVWVCLKAEVFYLCGEHASWIRPYL